MSGNGIGHGHSQGAAEGPGYWVRLGVTLLLVPLLLIALKPTLMRFVQSRAAGYAGTGRLDDAIRVSEKWLLFDGEDPAAWSDLAALYRSAGRRNEAVRAYERALALEPGNAKTHFELGMFYAWLKEWAAAAPQFERARQLSRQGAEQRNPSRYRSALTMLERCYTELGDSENAAAARAELAALPVVTR